ncbi:MAG: Y-family DNA polymerase [Bacteroidales bacterium]|nr:Y-family DNA polymerase [Bacteroidales bacterium]
MFGLVDGNNFFVSCQRVFRPDLNGRPVIVLSNNDGCAIARSNEAKALGIRMGDPAFKIRDIIRKYDVVVFSSAYSLYGDMSARMMMMFQSYVPEIEIYSIDEAFLNFSGMEHFNLKEYGSLIVQETTRGTGIPVSLGIAPTKTLAKVANRFAKKIKEYKGLCIIDSEEKRIKALQMTEISDVWGIGRRYSIRLNKIGVKTALDFVCLPRAWVRKNMTVVGEKTWCELRGEPCIDMELIQTDKKQICTSRSFGKLAENLDDISEAVASHAASCARKLRDQKSVAVSLMVFIHTNNFRPDLPQYFKNIVIELPVPTNSSIEIVHYALIGLKRIFASGYRYKKAGVIITEITKESAVQGNLFDSLDRTKHRKLMEAADKVTDRYGKQYLKLGSQGSGNNKVINMNQNLLSPSFSSRISDIITVKV